MEDEMEMSPEQEEMLARAWDELRRRKEKRKVADIRTKYKSLDTKDNKSKEDRNATQ